MTGLYLNIVIGFVVAAALFGGALALVFWLYRLQSGHSMRLPTPSFSSAGNALIALSFGAALAAGLWFVYGLAREDYAFWGQFTLTKYQAIDYTIYWLLVMPSLYWFGGSLLTSRREQVAEVGDVDVAAEGMGEDENEEPGSES